MLITNVITTQDVTCTENKAIEEDSTIDVINRANAENTHKQSLKLTEKPVKLASIQTKGKKQLRCCELSPSGEIVVYATATDVRMLKLETVSACYYIHYLNVIMPLRNISSKILLFSCSVSFL